MSQQELFNLHGSKVPASLFRWISSNGLADFARKNLVVAKTWADFCSPVNATRAAMLLAYMDLQCLFFIDDYSRDDFEEFFDLYEHILDGFGAENPRGLCDLPVLEHMDSGFHHAALQFLHYLKALNVDLSYYAIGKKKHLELIRNRNSLRRSGCEPTFVEQLRSRKITIYVEQWMSLWEVLEDRVLTEHERSSLDLQRAVDMHCEWHVLINERYSLGRDAKERQTNLVATLQREYRLSLSDALQCIKQREDDLLVRCRKCSERLISNAEEPKIRAYIEMFERCITGAKKVYRVMNRRYVTT